MKLYAAPDSPSLMSDYDVQLVDDSTREFYVNFHGPSDSTWLHAHAAPFEHGIWRVHVELPEQYPYRSPSIGFTNRIFHPNIDEISGSVCLDVINQTWSPMYDCFNIFETILPQLLRYPNPTDPLNSDAASLYLKNPQQYEKQVRQYVEKYAKQVEQPSAEQANVDEEDLDEISDVGSNDHDD